MKKLRGTGVALVTPFRNGRVDFGGLEKVVNHVISGGVEFVVPLGTTGETPVLSDAEKKDILECVISAVGKRVPIVAGFGGNNTQKIIEDIKNFHFKGISAILSSAPNYNKPTQEGIYQHYKAIGEVAPVPVIIYNVPSRTGKNVLAETTLRLAHSDGPFVAVKEASGNLEQCMKIENEKPDSFLLLSGDDNFTLPLLSFGGDGVISVVANAFPRLYSDMVRAGLKGDFKKAKTLHFKLFEITKLLFVENNPAGVKGVLNILDICSDEVRLPLVKLTRKTKRLLEEQVKEILVV